MPISRRQFFRGLVGQSDDRQREREDRVAAIETYVRTNLLPYDFALTGEQTAHVLRAVLAGVDAGDDDTLTYRQRTRMHEIVEDTVQPWREEYWKAEEARQKAGTYVSEFLSGEATPEDLRKLRQRFQIPYPGVLEEEIERQIRAWLSDLSNARLAACDGPALRALVFSELRSWC